MPGYLESYGISEERLARRGKLVKTALASVSAALVVGLILYSYFKNYRQESVVKAFVQLLERHDYQSAYRMYGCTEAQPCRDYAFQRFLDDWGPASAFKDAAAARVGDSQSCGTGVIVQLEDAGGKPVALWVERATNIVSFSPWPECPGKHLRIRAWLKSLFAK